MTTLTISLPESLREFVDEQVRTRGFADTSDYLNALLREAEAHHHLQNVLLEALDGEGDDIEVTPQFWSELRAETSELIRKPKPRG